VGGRLSVGGGAYSAGVWSPVDDVQPVEWFQPEPGTDEPYAVIRRVLVRKNGVEVVAYRVVTFAEPRTLIRDGYYPDLATASREAHMSAIGEAGSGVLSNQDGYAN
jgi:hypothetical protein